MGAPVAPAASSLDRLKSLDSLPDIETQLREARQLCTHPARAEMVLKWILGKLKSTTQFCLRSESWDLLSACFRLLHLQRLAFLLSSNGFIKALQSTFAVPELEEDVLSAVDRVVTLVLDLASSPDGASLKAVVTVDSTTAASISGNWLQHLNLYYSRDGASRSIQQSVLKSPLQLWNLREPSSADDELFSSHCLVPVALLLTLLDNESGLSTKRKRGGEPVGSLNAIRGSLESLIAKHVILPARAVHFAEHESQTRKGSKNRPDVHKAGIKERLGPLKMAARNSTDGRVVRAAASVLDIALRAVAMFTPRQRSHERPWIELVFEALQNCFSVDERNERSRVLTEMLRILVNRRYPLSQRKLSDLVKKHALPLDDQTVDLKMVREVVQLDANTFNDKEIARSLFAALSSLASDRVNVSEANVAESIVVPIINSFAQTRRLSDFIDLWNEQLLEFTPDKNGSTWLKVARPFAERVEESFSNADFLGIYDRFALKIKNAALSDGEFESRDQCIASLTVLSALLQGVRTDELRTTLQSRLDELFLALFKLVEDENSNVASTAPCQLWPLLTRTFELWFPCWAAQQPARQTVAERGVSLLIRKTFQDALSQSVVETNFSAEQRSAAACAQKFVATLCECFIKYEEHAQCVSLAENALQQLAKGNESAIDVLVDHPDLLVNLPTEPRARLLSSVVESAQDSEIESGENLQHRVSALSTIAHAPTHEDLFAALLHQLEGHSGRKRRSDDERTALSSLRPLVKSASSNQRSQILDTILDLPKAGPDSIGATMLQDRLALIAELVAISPSDLLLGDSADKVWKLSSMFNEKASAKARNQTSMLGTVSNLKLLEDISCQVVAALLTAQSKHKSKREVLVQMSSGVKELCTKEKMFVHRPASLMVLYTMLASLEKAPDSVKQEMSHRDSSTVSRYVKTLLDDVEKEVASSEHDEALATIFNALLTLPDSLLDRTTTRDELVASIAAGLDQAEEHIQRYERLAAIYFQLRCRYGTLPGQQLTDQAEDVLQRDLAAKDYATVLSAYENALASGDRQEKSTAILSLVQREAPTIQSILLLRSAVKSIKKEHLDTDLDISGVKIVTHILNSTKTPQLSRLAWQTLAAITKEQPFLLNQHTIEQTLIAMTQTRANNLSDLLPVLEALFSHHRARLQGRFHLLIALFESLLTSLLHSPHQNPRQARLLAKLLESFCNPPTHHLLRRKQSSNLVDESRKAQAYAGQFAPYILHHYCAQVLVGSLETGVRETLMPGIWALIEAMEVNNKEGVKVLSSAMNNSERAVLRSVYEDWKRFGKWEGL